MSVLPSPLKSPATDLVQPLRKMGVRFVNNDFVNAVDPFEMLTTQRATLAVFWKLATSGMLSPLKSPTTWRTQPPVPKLFRLSHAPRVNEAPVDLATP